jgi:hypothetical protein
MPRIFIATAASKLGEEVRPRCVAGMDRLIFPRSLRTARDLSKVGGMVQAMLRDETWPNSVKVAPEKPLLGRPYRDTGETPRTHRERTRGFFWRFLCDPHDRCELSLRPVPLPVPTPVMPSLVSRRRKGATFGPYRCPCDYASPTAPWKAAQKGWKSNFGLADGVEAPVRKLARLTRRECAIRRCVQGLVDAPTFVFCW